MRWEEIWDGALRIRNLFVTTPLPPEMSAALQGELQPFGDGRPVVIRSSAPGEDSAERSFAGLHESFVGIAGIAAIVDHVKLVWASLLVRPGPSVPSGTGPRSLQEPHGRL
ncbi:MAG: hypothetical protein MZU95_05060 [Desulfomicrobium escambiense]|nr:hypothetical protein [Desulfomicrobium escambiense]